MWSKICTLSFKRGNWTQAYYKGAGAVFYHREEKIDYEDPDSFLSRFLTLSWTFDLTSRDTLERLNIKSANHEQN